MTCLFDPPAIPSLPILGSDLRFPVRRIFCIGRNYADHAAEMGSVPDLEQPMFFCKPADAVVTDGADVPYPSATASLHHEVEMVVALAAGGADIAVGNAMALIFGYGVGLDLTRRDLQARAKEKRHPWDAAKGFDHSAPVSALRRATEAAPGADTVLRLEINGETRQRTTLDHMLHGVPQIIAALSRLFELKAGDLIFTGTPEGVGPVVRGDRVEGEIEGVGRLAFELA